MSDFCTKRDVGERQIHSRLGFSSAQIRSTSLTRSQQGLCPLYKNLKTDKRFVAQPQGFLGGCGSGFFIMVVKYTVFVLW